MAHRLIRSCLPDGWRDNLAVEVVVEIIAVERYSDLGHFILSEPDHKGYRWVRLCKGHPYADRKGWQRLHRYLLMRKLKRRLEWYEHAHHLPGSAKDTTNADELEPLEATDHGVYHAGERKRCGGHIPVRENYKDGDDYG